MSNPHQSERVKSFLTAVAAVEKASGLRIGYDYCKEEFMVSEAEESCILDAIDATEETTDPYVLELQEKEKQREEERIRRVEEICEQRRLEDVRRAEIEKKLRPAEELAKQIEASAPVYASVRFVETGRNAGRLVLRLRKAPLFPIESVELELTEEGRVIYTSSIPEWAVDAVSSTLHSRAAGPS